MKRVRKRVGKPSAIVLGVVGVALALTAAAALAAGEGPTSVQVGNIEVIADGGFTPKALSKKTPEPIGLKVEGKIKTLNGTHPPAAKEILIEGDKNAVIDTKGIPACSNGKLQSRDTKAVEAACGPAIIGTGKTTVEVSLPEQRPINVNSKLLLVNGGTSGGTTTWYVHAFFNAPITGAIVTTVKIKKHPHGRYGTLSVASIPKISGGAGSVTSFQLNVDKTVKVGGKSFHPISAKCSDGKLQVHAEAKFADGTKAATEVVRSCTPKG